MLHSASAELEHGTNKARSINVMKQESHYTVSARSAVHHTGKSRELKIKWYKMVLIFVMCADSSSSSGSSSRLNLAYLLHPISAETIDDDTAAAYNVAQSYNASAETARDQVAAEHQRHHGFWPLPAVKKNTVTIANDRHTISTNSHAGPSREKQVVVERQSIILPVSAPSAKPQMITSVKVSLESPPDRPELIHKAEGTSPTNVNLPPLREQLRDIGFHSSVAP